MQNKLYNLLKDSSLYTVSGLAARLIGIIMVPIYTRIFSPAEYGIIDLITTVTALITIILVSGMDSGIARHFIDTASDSRKKAVASTGVIYTITVSVVVILILLPFASDLSFLVLGSREHWLLLFAGIAVIPFTMTTSALINLLRFRMKAMQSAAVSMGILVLQTALIIVAVVILKQGILGIFMATLATHLVFSAACLWLNRHYILPLFSVALLRKMLAFGIPYLPLSFAFYIMNSSSRYFLVQYNGLDAVGLYGIGFRLASVIGIITAGFELAWGPFVMSIYKESDARKTFSRVFDYASIFICAGILLLSLFSRELLYVFTTTTYLEAYTVVPFLSASIAAYTLGAYFAIGISLSKKTVHMAWAGLVAAAFNLLLNFLLIPHFGATGAAAACMASFILLGIILLAVSQRLYPVPYRFRANIVMYIITAFIIFIACQFLLDRITWINVLLKVALSLIFCATPFILRLIGKAEVNYLLSLAASVLKTKRTGT